MEEDSAVLYFVIQWGGPSLGHEGSERSVHCLNVTTHVYKQRVHDNERDHHSRVEEEGRAAGRAGALRRCGPA